MPAHYNLRSCLRQLSRGLLAELLNHHAIDVALDLSTLKKQQIDPIFAAINALPDDRRQPLDEDFRNIVSLASVGGVSQIIEEARFQGFEIIQELRPIASLIDRAAWACLHHRSAFEKATRLAVRDLLPGRYWKRRLPIAALPDANLSGAVNPLATAISAYFTEQEGRGKACSIDYLRRGNLHHLFAYPEDFPASPLAWTAQGLGPHRYRPAFEVVFVFDHAAGWLDIYCEAGKETIEQLRSLFAKSVGALHELPQANKPAYRLEGLRARNFQFVRAPDSLIRDVRLKRLGFALRTDPTKFSIETDPTNDRFALHGEVERVFCSGAPEPRRIAVENTKIISATLTATIDGGGRPRTRTFDITEKSCALKYDGHDLLLRNLLVASGIDVTGKPHREYGESHRPAA